MLTFDLPSCFFEQIMLTFDLPKICLFLQNGGVGRSKVNIGRSKVNTFFFQQNQVGQRSPPCMEGGDL